MSKRAVLLFAAVAAVALAVVYLRPEQPAPSPPAQTLEPAAARAPIDPPRPSVDRGDGTPITPELPAQTTRVPDRREPPTVVALIGDEEIPLRMQPALGAPLSAEGIDDDGRSSGFFEPLADAARAGSGDAARFLQAQLDACRGYPRNRAEFDAAMEKTRKGYAQSGGIVAPGEQPADWNSVTSELERRYHRCEGVTDAMYQTSLDLLRESVEGRDDPAAAQRFAYAEAVRKTDPKAALTQYEILWQNGYLLALGRVNDSLPYRIAWTAASIAYLHAPPENMAALEASTSPSEFQAASKEAARILRNPNCCKL